MSFLILMRFLLEPKDQEGEGLSPKVIGASGYYTRFNFSHAPVFCESQRLGFGTESKSWNLGTG